MAYGVAAVLVAGSGVDADLIVTHFSFFPSSITAALGVVSDFSVSSSDVTLSSVSASTPVVVSDSEELEDDDEVASVVAVVSATTTAAVAAGVGSVDADEVEVAAEESLFAAASFFACLARSLLSNFYSNVVMFSKTLFKERIKAKTYLFDFLLLLLIDFWNTKSQ